MVLSGRHRAATEDRGQAGFFVNKSGRAENACPRILSNNAASPLIGGVLLALLLAPGGASAQGVGFQGGASIDPEQVYIGVHAETRPLFGRLHFRPAIEGGFGDDITLAALNIEFLYKVPIEGSAWNFYQASGPAVNIFRIDRPLQDADVDVRAGFVFSTGFQHKNGFFAEIKVGVGDSPNLKFGVGWTVR